MTKKLLNTRDRKKIKHFDGKQKVLSSINYQSFPFVFAVFHGFTSYDFTRLCSCLFSNTFLTNIKALIKQKKSKGLFCKLLPHMNLPIWGKWRKFSQKNMKEKYFQVVKPNDYVYQEHKENFTWGKLLWKLKFIKEYLNNFIFFFFFFHNCEIFPWQKKTMENLFTTYLY